MGFPQGPLAMPSILHEAFVALFRNRPSLAAELLRDVLHARIPAYREIRFESAQLSEVVPAEYRADLVVLLLDGVPVLAIVVEVQLGRDDDKRSTWPAYLAGFRARLRCPVWLLVVCPDPSVARWCAEPIEMGHPGWVLVPTVLGPEAVPELTDPRQAIAAPELAVLSTLTHASSPSAERIARAAIEGVASLDDERLRFYTDLVLMVLPEAARRALETMMTTNYEYQSEFVKRWLQREADARAEGTAEGEAKGKADALLAVLEGRGLAISDEARKRIASCRDPQQLDAWIRRAVTVSSVENLLK